MLHIGRMDNAAVDRVVKLVLGSPYDEVGEPELIACKFRFSESRQS